MQQYNELQVKNTNTIYIITDAQKIFIGEKEYGGVGNIQLATANKNGLMSKQDKANLNTLWNNRNNKQCPVLIAQKQNGGNNNWVISNHPFKSINDIKDGQKIICYLSGNTPPDDADMTLIIEFQNNEQKSAPCYLIKGTHIKTQFKNGSFVSLIYKKNLTMPSGNTLSGWWLSTSDNNSREQIIDKLMTVTSTNSLSSAQKVALFNNGLTVFEQGNITNLSLLFPSGTAPFTLDTAGAFGVYWAIKPNFLTGLNTASLALVYFSMKLKLNWASESNNGYATTCYIKGMPFLPYSFKPSGSGYYFFPTTLSTECTGQRKLTVVVNAKGNSTDDDSFQIRDINTATNAGTINDTGFNLPATNKTTFLYVSGCYLTKDTIHVNYQTNNNIGVW